MIKFSLFILTLIFILFSGCKSVQNHPQIEKYKYFKKESIKDYELLSYFTSNDTILIVLKKELLKNCRNLSIKKFKLLKLKKINKINNNIGFFYNTKTTNGIRITAGSFEPEQKKTTQIYSYSGMPYLIESCE